MNIPNRIREHRLARRMTQEKLAEETGLSVSYVTRLESGGRNLAQKHMIAFSKALGVKPADLLPEGAEPAHNVVRVMGRIGAGAEILSEFEQIPEGDGLYEIEVHFPVPEDAIALEVVGESMWPRYDPGDVIIVWRFGNHPDEIIGWEAAVQTEDGRRFLKRVLKGSQPGTYDLESHNAATIRNTKLIWVAEVLSVVRSGQWRKLDANARRRILRKATKS